MSKSYETKNDYIVECIKYQKLLFSPWKKKGFVPENGSEVFIKHIPKEDTEYDLLKFFQTVGSIFQVRLMMTENGSTNRGFAYVTYFDASTAKKAVATLNRVAYNETAFLSIEVSLNNCRLFIGGIPSHKRKDQVWQELQSKGVKNIIDVIMYKSYSDRSENRGFVFVEFRTHEEAAYFRAKFGKSLRLWDNPVVVDWSVPIPQIDESVMDGVKIIYLRNLDVCMSREDVHGIVVKYTSKATIEKVYKFKNYAFIHLINRSCAERLLERLKEYFNNSVVEVTWAKPASKFTTQDYRHSRVNFLSAQSPSRKPKISSNASYASSSSNFTIFKPSRNLPVTKLFPEPGEFVNHQQSAKLCISMQPASDIRPLSTSTPTSDTSVDSTKGSLSPYEIFYSELVSANNPSPSEKQVIKFSKPNYFGGCDHSCSICNNNKQSIESSTASYQRISMSDLNIIPHDMGLKNLQEFIGDIGI